jgi:hypothetical protein
MIAFTQPGWDFLTFAGTVILIVYAALERHAPRKSRPTGNGVFESAASPGGFSKRGIASLILGGIFAIITVALMLTRPSLVGPEGPRGAQGPPGPADDRIAATAEAVKAIIVSERLQYGLGKFTKLKDEYTKEMETTLDTLKRPDAARMGGPLLGIYGVEAEIHKNLETYLGIDVNLRSHPNFDLIHSRSVPGDSQISRPDLQEEYRMYYDQFHTSADTLNDVLPKYHEYINRNEQTITNKLPILH